MIKLVLLILAIICFILLAFNVALGSIALLPAGLALGFASFLPFKE